MQTTDLKERYFWWMVSLVSDGKAFKHEKLFRLLNETPFTYLLAMDGDRYENGIDLRYEFGYEENLPDSEVSKVLDDIPCSVLEMMVALAYRCEVHIMADEDIGNRTGKWFWTMISCMGLITQDDDHFDRTKVNYIIGRFLARKYDRDGSGGLFIIRNHPETDMRTVEIWYQLALYLHENT